MKFKLTYILILAVILLGVYVYFFERGEKIETGKEIYAVKEEEIQKFSLVELQCEKLEGKWLITKPKKYETDEEEIKAIVKKLAKPEIDRKIEENPSDLKIYGLDRPSFQATIWLVNGSSRSFVVGNETPIKGSYYAKSMNNPSVYIMAGYQVQSLKKELKDLRKRNIMEIEIDKVGQLEIVSAKKDLVYEKVGEQWFLKKPKAFEVTTSGVEGILNTLKNLRVQDFVEDEPKDIKLYGLNKPQLTARVWSGKEKAALALLIGKKLKDKEQNYARREGLSPVYTVDTSLIKDLNKEPNDIRDK